MIPIPTFVAGQTLRTTPDGWQVTNSTVDQPVPPANGGYNFNPWEGYVGSTGNYETALDYEAAFNASFPLLSVSASGVLVY